MNNRKSNLFIQKELEKQEKKFRKTLEKTLSRERRKWAAQIQGGKRKRARAEQIRSLRDGRNGWEEEVSSHSEEMKKKYPQESKIIREAHNGDAIDYVIENFTPIHPEKFLKQSKFEGFKILEKSPIKANIKLHCEFEHINNDTGERKVEKKFLSTPALVIQTKEDREGSMGRCYCNNFR